MLKLFNSRRPLILAAILLVAGGLVFEEWHRASAARHHAPAIDATNSAADPLADFNLTNADFAAQADLWKNAGVPVYDTDLSYANYVFHSALNAENFSQLATRTADNGQNYTLPVTVSGGHLDYAHFSIGTFKANLTLTPLKAKPDDLFPTLFKPGVGGSFDF